MLAEATRRPAVLVVALNAQGREVGVALIKPGHSLVIGRHTACGLRLPAEMIALRHLVAHARAELPGAAPSIRLWELNTGQPFLTEDGRPGVAVTAKGLLYAAVGEYAILLVPTIGRSGLPWPTRAEEAWEMIPPRQFTEPWDRELHAPPLRRLRADGREYMTDISRGEPPRMLGESGCSRDAWAVVRLVRGKDEVELGLSREELQHGVLLGRYDRCGISLGELRSISRVHLMLVLLDTEVLAIDTASTVGTRRGWRKLETAPLGDRASLELGKTLWLHWRRLPMSAAWGRWGWLSTPQTGEADARAH